MSSIYCEYKDISVNSGCVDTKFSKKLLKHIKRQRVQNKFTIKVCRGTNPNFQKSLRKLLLHRKINFLFRGKEDVVSAFSPAFDKLLTTFTSIPAVKPRCCIYELYVNEKYAGSDLYFYSNNHYLCYIRAFNRAFSKLSPGMILAYLTHKDLSEKHRTVIIDYTRGDESYKFRIGGKNLTLYQLYS